MEKFLGPGQTHVLTARANIFRLNNKRRKTWTRRERNPSAL